MVVIHKRDDADVPTFEISGELTLDCADTLRDQLMALLADNASLRLNLMDVLDFDSSALQVLLHVQREAVCKGVPLQWIGFSLAISQVLQLLNLSDELALTDVAA
ncbi:STAS domain-containing protein [Ectopseudomonas mendocina]|uniref:STAS domain-containing protein n=1 Tax=Ectopseudomonas mendocina TaxID=300 RepID=A0ABZ2RL35_ECTME